MNREIEKWLTIGALGSWVVSIGAMVAIGVQSSLPANRLFLQLHVSEQTLRLRSFDLDAMIQARQSLELTSKLGLEGYQGHWLDHIQPQAPVVSSAFSDLKVAPAVNVTAWKAKVAGSVVARSPQKNHRFRSVVTHDALGF